MAEPLTYFEDVVIGEVLVTPAMTLTEAHVNLYSGLAGEAAEDPTSIPDLLPLCVSTGLGWRVNRPPLAVLAFIGMDWQITRPLRVGDTIHSASCAAIRRSMREGGIIIEDHEVFDQHGQVVQRGRVTFLVARRPRETPEEGATP
jgi:acyl dehydratase